MKQSQIRWRSGCSKVARFARNDMMRRFQKLQLKFVLSKSVGYRYTFTGS